MEQETKRKMIDQLVGVIQEVFPNDAWDDSAEDTAARILGYWLEYANGGDEHGIKLTAFPKIADQLIVVKDIEFASTCAHHLLPFMGVAHVGYVPHRLQIGLSKIPRLVRYYASRPQVQERLTRQIASSLKDAVEAKGVAVVLQATHTCMACRGVRAYGAEMVTSEMRGVFLTAPAARQEFMEMTK